MSQFAVRLEVHHHGGQVTSYEDATYERFGDRVWGEAGGQRFEHDDVWTVVAEMPAPVKV